MPSPLVAFLAGGDDKVATLHVGVPRSIRVGLEFVVAPTAAAGFHDPLGRIRQGAVSRAEFVAPDENIVRRLCRSVGRPAAKKRRRQQDRQNEKPIRYLPWHGSSSSMRQY